MISIVFALLLPCLLLCTGIGIDLSRQFSAKSALQRALDAGLLAAARSLSDGKTSASKLTSIARGYFDARLPPRADVTVTSFNVSVSGAEITGKASGQISTSFLSIFGTSELTVSITSTARAITKTYFQIVFVVDVSSSMSVGATEAEVRRMQSALGCAFTCHDVNNYFGHGDMYTFARNMGFKAKIDYESEALLSFIDGLRDLAAANPNYYTASLWTFGSTVKQVANTTTDLAALETAARSITLEETLPPTVEKGWTSTSLALANVRKSLSNVGDGTSSSKRKTYVVFLTDGLEDSVDASLNRQFSTDYVAECGRLKSLGATIVAIHAATSRIADPENNIYDYLFGTTQSGMQTCASPGDNYHLAAEGPAIIDAMKATLMAVAGRVRLVR